MGRFVEYARSTDELVARVIRHLDRPRPISAELSAAARATLSHWLGNADGRSGERVVSTVKREVYRTLTTSTIAESV
jgi:hypothetical protein